MTMREIEIETVFWTVHKHGGDKKAAARELDLGLTTIYRRMHDYERAQAAKTPAPASPPIHITTEGALAPGVQR